MGGENVFPCEGCGVQCYDEYLMPVILSVNGEKSRTRYICNQCVRSIEKIIHTDKNDGLTSTKHEENEKTEDIEARLDNLEYTLDKLHTVLKQIGDALIDMREHGDFNAYILKEGLRSL